MATSSNFLPPYLNTTANKKFLAGTLDLLTNAPQLARFDGIIGRKISNGQLLEGSYLLESTAPRQNYQLEPAFVTYDTNANITNVSNFIDLLNSCANKEAITSAWNRLLTCDSYSWLGFTDLDKIINYQNYIWMNQTNNTWYWNSNISIPDVTTNIQGQISYTNVNVTLMNGMIISCSNSSQTYIVEGVGKEIILVPTSNIQTPAFSTDQQTPADYITINRAAIDQNLWSATNLWVHKDTLNTIISLLSITPTTPLQPAVRPIIEFLPMVLFGYGKIGLSPITYLDQFVPDAFSIVQNAVNFECDGYYLKSGDSVIFNADKNSNVRSTIYDVNFIVPANTVQIPSLYPVQAISQYDIPTIDTNTITGLITIDGYQTELGDRILVANQTIPQYNGIYIASNGTWTRSSEFPYGEISSAQYGVYVLYGTTYNNTYYTAYMSGGILHINNSLQIPTIQLSPRNVAENENCVLISSGTSYADSTAIFNNGRWAIALQNKTAINQTPLFDIFDLSNNSLSSYTSFSGSKLFSYELGVGANDSILGFPLSYGSIGNLNDINFSYNYVTDTVSYQSKLIPINSGRAHIIDYNTQVENIYDPWQFVPSKLELYQNILAIGETNISFVGSLLVKSTTNSYNTQVFVDGTLLESSQYNIAQNNGIVTFNISSEVSPTSTVLIKVLCPTAITNAWYDVPPAFENNPLGANMPVITMSNIRNHASACAMNANYTSDIINLQLTQFKGVAGSLLFNEALSILPVLLLTNNKFDIDAAIRVAADDYTLFKQRLINIFSQLYNASNLTPKQAVDQALQKLSAGNVPSQPWNTSDMCFWGGNQSNITITNKINTFNLKQSYSWNSPNSLSLQVYLNDSQLINGIDYTANGSILTITRNLNISDRISIYEISNTTGSYIPATPTKLGLSAAYVPEIYLDTTYQTPRNVLRGHDGSITTCFNDYRDNLLLDYEIRVYNNLKVNNQIWADTIQTHVPLSGRFRNELTTDIAPYTSSEQNSIQQRMFYEWATQYNVNYLNTFYDSADNFTWNWSGSLDRIGNKRVI